MKAPEHTKHESAALHVSGQALYIDDLAISNELHHGFVVTSKIAAGQLKAFNLDKAMAVSGVVAVLSYKDIPGENQMGPVIKDEPVLVANEIEFIGQAMFLIAAETIDIARTAANLIDIEIKEHTPILTLEEAIEKNHLLHPPRKIECGNTQEAFANAELTLEGSLKSGAQEHWYLETQSCIAVPGEANEIKIYSSTQHPSETQEIVADVLALDKMEVEVEARRLGGAFGGKETQGNHVAAWTALLANACGKPVKIRLNRDEDQKMTGKRHPFLSKYKVAYTKSGKITAASIELNANAGASTDLSMAILERAMFHADNCYFIPNMKIVGKAYKTNVPSNTAFRGFGGPQGMAVIETIVDRIARELKIDAAIVRNTNYYQHSQNNTTHYNQLIENNRLAILEEQLLESSQYFERRKQVNTFNQQHQFIKRGLALTPVKFGISFTTSFLNQAGALVNIYKDGSVLVNHGGIEMGQGLHTKIKQIAALELGIDIKHIKVNATNTAKVPNTSATAASSGSDLNGMAVKNAMDKLKNRIAPIAANYFNKELAITKVDDIHFKNDWVIDSKHPKRKITFKEAVMKAYFAQTSLSATGFYRTPNIHYDKAKGKGKPFHYYAFGMAVSEVSVDVLTGYHKIIRTDIVHDAGKSINESLDIGQIEGGFVQGLGWLTTEECKWDSKGNLLNHSPDTYKIPGINDIPKEFRISLLKGYPNPNTIRQSKAVGEPPFMLAFSVWLAIKDAISATNDHKEEPQFEIPATNEKIILAIEQLRLSDKSN